MWKDDIVRELQKHNLFESPSHLSRFKELLDCYYKDPFFTPGLVKCMYLSCWDEEHFMVMLDMLNQMKFAPNIGLDDMSENGELLAEDSSEHLYDRYIFKLSCAFLQDDTFDLSALPDNIEEEGKYIIRQALEAAIVIDDIPHF